MSEPPAATSTGAIHGPSKLDAEVVSTNPYSRLMALERMGVVPDYSRIRGVSIAIIGVGGVGSVAAEMLVRCGVGRLILFDYDTVELANMNRLFYRPDQAGLTKVHAAKATLSAINPDVDIECFNCDVCSLEGYRTMESRVREGGIPATPHNDSPGPAPAPIPVNLVLSCVDNYTARMAVNKLCNALSQPWIESGVSEHAMSGHIQFILPGRTPCFECVPPVAVETGMDERLIKREGVCAASLPTTMSLVAANLVQNALKYTLGFGRVSYYVGYNAIDDYFPHEKLRRNPWCRSEKCRELQQQWQGWVHPDDAPRTMGVVAAASGANGSGAVQGGVGDDGEEDIAAKWGITVVSEGFGAEPSAPNSSSTSGSAAAPIPTATASGDNGTAATNTDVQEGQDDEESLGDLMSQLGSLMRM